MTPKEFIESQNDGYIAGDYTPGEVYSLMLDYSKLVSKNEEVLLKALQSIVHDFEIDYMIDGKIVDKPSRLLLDNYNTAKKAIESYGSK